MNSILSLEFDRYFLDYSFGPLFATRTDVLPPNPVESPGGEIGDYNFAIPLKFDWQLHNAAVDVPISI